MRTSPIKRPASPAPREDSKSPPATAEKRKLAAAIKIYEKTAKLYLASAAETEELILTSIADKSPSLARPSESPASHKKNVHAVGALMQNLVAANDSHKEVAARGPPVMLAAVEAATVSENAARALLAGAAEAEAAMREGWFADATATATNDHSHVGINALGWEGSSRESSKNNRARRPLHAKMAWFACFPGLVCRTDGQVKQIVDAFLNTQAPDSLRTNFVARYGGEHGPRKVKATLTTLPVPPHSDPPAHFATLYRNIFLHGAHVIKLGPTNGSNNDAAAIEAIAAWWRGLQVGGGTAGENADWWIERGAER
ncbi:hypothetical protein BDK51DRAFT_35049 [Blyttiomyces helicus]|uniref:Uncharacterized protein n=1 Tax=Blyttiomyces helicus TaxID=388810 RepID=A0A4P9WDQ9_9FUNG|nr:hypothetical protein BDK51DRAFT_35049 [Blyttiomyces helicus]|eukprot:RKO90841.1 hypothetical protein BDK51DRAFT_35049 [Blyttiomyces helicus]